ncbi:MAG: hypothetical protein Q7S83_00110 [bacterium]|nr:hypothetical protein [bacterium]
MTWQPEPEFLEFLDEMEALVGDKIPQEVWVMIKEIRTGSKLGKIFYDKAMNDKQFRGMYEEWKQLR